jgi:hypothetical protein
LRFDDIDSSKKLERKSKEIILPLDDDLDRYLKFLVRIKLVRHEQEAALAALKIYKKLNMHDWLPYIYRSGNERIFLVGQGMLNDILSAIGDQKLYEVARVSALKRRIINPFDPDLDLTESDNWDVILNELENMAWGKFTRDREDIMIEYLGIPISFLMGYFETLFQVEFKLRQTRNGEVYVLSKEKSKTQAWL